jgi:hypothetical protein
LEKYNMIGDLLKSASRVALVAVAGISVSGLAAQAADLGGNCCADLEGATVKFR